MFDLTGKVAIVTGGSRGIGRACCEALAGQGALVVVNYVKGEAQAKEVADGIIAKGGKAEIAGFDMADVKACETAIDEIAKRLGRLDILVANAGISIDALVDRTAKLPQIALDAPNGPIGRDTVSAMQAGIIFGFVGQAEGMIARLKHAIGEDARVVATGGLAPVIAKHTAEIEAVEPHLVLEGLRIFYERTARAPVRGA